MGANNLLSAALKKGDQEDILVFENGRELPLGRLLPYENGTEMLIHIVPKQKQDITDDKTLAKHILQEILDGGS